MSGLGRAEVLGNWPENVRALVPRQRWDTARLPVVDALRAARHFEAKGASDNGRTAQLIDQLGVWMHFGGGFGVHGYITRHVYFAVNTTCNHAMFSGGTMAHGFYAPLHEASLRRSPTP